MRQKGASAEGWKARFHGAASLGEDQNCTYPRFREAGAKLTFLYKPKIALRIGADNPHDEVDTT
jgi:hypothetical protein